MVSGCPSILVVSSRVDTATDSVVLYLRDSGTAFYRVNTEDLPLDAESSYSIGSDHSGRWTWVCPHFGDIDLHTVAAIWYRRHRFAPMPSNMLPAYQEYCIRETDWFVRGMLYATNAAWMSHPLSIQRAESKVYQLALARQIGFHVPETIISNEARAIRRFYDVCSGDIVAKPLRRGYFDYGDRQTCVFTEAVSADDLQDEESLRLAPVIYQERIEKECDIRVTVVGDVIYGAAIHSQSIPSAATDWRKSETDDLPHSRYDLPEIVQSLCLRLLGEMGLSFGAIDLVLAPDGRYYFLEINPNGQWLWIEDKLGYPISSSIARWLTEHAE